MTALSKQVDLTQLESELVGAGVSINGLGTLGDPPDQIHTYDETGASIDLPPDALAVIEAHEPSPPPPNDAELYTDYLRLAQEATADIGVQILAEVVRGLLPR